MLLDFTYGKEIINIIWFCFLKLCLKHRGLWCFHKKSCSIICWPSNSDILPPRRDSAHYSRHTWPPEGMCMSGMHKLLFSFFCHHFLLPQFCRCRQYLMVPSTDHFFATPLWPSNPVAKTVGRVAPPEGLWSRSVCLTWVDKKMALKYATRWSRWRCGDLDEELAPLGRCSVELIIMSVCELCPFGRSWLMRVLRVWFVPQGYHPSRSRFLAMTAARRRITANRSRFSISATPTWPRTYIPTWLTGSL